MAKKRYIDTKFWSDSWIQTLDPLERYFYIYLLTNEHTDICGIYEVPLKIMAVETGLEMEMVDKLLKRLRKEKKVYYIDGWVFVKNFIKHQILNDSVIAGIKRSLSQIPINIVNYILTLLPECKQTGDSEGGVCDILYLTLLNLTKPNLTKLNNIPPVGGTEKFSKEKHAQLSDKMKDLYDKTFGKLPAVRRPAFSLIMKLTYEKGENAVEKALGNLRENKNFSKIEDFSPYLVSICK